MHQEDGLISCTKTYNITYYLSLVIDYYSSCSTWPVQLRGTFEERGTDCLQHFVHRSYVALFRAVICVVPLTPLCLPREFGANYEHSYCVDVLSSRPRSTAEFVTNHNDDDVEYVLCPTYFLPTCIVLPFIS